MNILKQTYRTWWQTPRAIGEREEEREISFLELFYDLVFVAIVIQLTHTVAGHVTLEAIVSYMALFAMVWWAWMNGTLYHELHGNNDIRTRLFTFLQMAALGGMAIFIPTAFAEGYQGFAFMYTLFLVVITYLWYRSGVYDKRHRAIARPYVFGFLVTIVMFVASIFVGPELAWKLWGGAIALSLVLPFAVNRFATRTDAEHIEQAQRISPAVVERIGLLTMIVLGESIISLVRGAEHLVPFYGVDILMIGGLFGVVIALWWIYFHFIARRIPIQKTGTRLAWIYLHLPFLISIGLTSAGILHVVKYAQEFGAAERWLLLGPMASCALLVFMMMCTLQKNPRFAGVYQSGRRALLIASGLILVVGLLELGRTMTIAACVLIMCLPVWAAFIAWIRLHHSGQLSQES